MHLDVELDHAYRNLLSAGNYGEQHGWLVVEFMPRDGGHLPEPSAGERRTRDGIFTRAAARFWRRWNWFRRWTRPRATFPT